MHNRQWVSSEHVSGSSGGPTGGALIITLSGFSSLSSLRFSLGPSSGRLAVARKSTPVPVTVCVMKLQKMAHADYEFF